MIVSVCVRRCISLPMCVCACCGHKLAGKATFCASGSVTCAALFIYNISLSSALFLSPLHPLCPPLLSRKPSCDVAIVVIVVDAVHILPAAFCAAFIVRVSACLRRFLLRS